MGTTGITLRRKLGAVRLWWRATRILSGLTWALSAVILLALICYHSDRLLVLSSHAREMWRTGIEVSALLLLVLVLLRPLLHAARCKLHFTAGDWHLESQGGL